jgi:FkbM family methyltransferase
MGKILDTVYASWASPGLLEIAKKYKLEFSWIIEAGCHDGTDTLKFLDLPNVLKVYAFEPDIVAANKAQENFQKHVDRISLSKFALLDQPGFIQLSSPTGNFGDGTTLIEDFIQAATPEATTLNLIPCTTLDIELSDAIGRGLIWLDVEGSADKVLAGATQVLEKIDLIQVEVDLHDSTYRKGNFFKVNRILRQRDFVITHGPIHPGYFGDAIYARKSILSLRGKLRYLLLSFLMYSTHKLIYPLLKKPSS